MKQNLLERFAGANWKTKISMLGGVLMATLTWLSTVSYDMGQIALIIPPEYKLTVTKIAGISALFLLAYNAIAQKSRDVTGGVVKQASDGSVIAKGTVDVSNLPEFFEVNGIRKRTVDASEEELEAVKLAVGSTSITA